MKERVRINSQIRVRELRVIDSEGGNLGVMTPEDAIKEAQKQGLDLIENVTNDNFLDDQTSKNNC